MVPSHLVSGLAYGADAAINRVLRTGAANVGQAPPTGEVGFVAAVVLGAVPGIATAWRPLLQPHGISVSLSGVFVHQTPQATFTDLKGNQKRCELADLLVVIEDVSAASVVRRWAALVQAKMASGRGGKTITMPGDLVQLDLFSRWPPFSLPAGFAPGTRNFSTCKYAGNVRDCGRYGLISPQPSPAWHQHAPAAIMPPGGIELGTFLARMLETGQVGFGREATGLGDDWSRTVDELMRVTTKLALKAPGVPAGQGRGVTAMALYDGIEQPGAYGVVASGPPPSGGRQQSADESPEGQGVSVLRIRVKRNPDAHSD